MFLPWKFPSAHRCTHPPKERFGQGRLLDDTETHTHILRYSYLELWHQPAGLQVQRVLVETQLPVHHLLVVELKLNVTTRRNVDLCLKGLHVLRISPVKQRHCSLYDDAELYSGFKSKKLIQYLTMPAALPLALA